MHAVFNIHNTLLLPSFECDEVVSEEFHQVIRHLEMLPPLADWTENQFCSIHQKAMSNPCVEWLKNYQKLQVLFVEEYLINAGLDLCEFSNREKYFV